ncbi:hypothetical protein HY389_01965 [Candidatus Daviesbacteria bacterium]|nr:hypothetical protein [Candidatus Daviesbacteria bacterium]
MKKEVLFGTSILTALSVACSSGAPQEGGPTADRIPIPTPGSTSTETATPTLTAVKLEPTKTPESTTAPERTLSPQEKATLEYMRDVLKSDFQPKELPVFEVKKLGDKITYTANLNHNNYNLPADLFLQYIENPTGQREQINVWIHQTEKDEPVPFSPQRFVELLKEKFNMPETILPRSPDPIKYYNSPAITEAVVDNPDGTKESRGLGVLKFNIPQKTIEEYVLRACKLYPGSIAYETKQCVPAK